MLENLIFSEHKIVSRNENQPQNDNYLETEDNCGTYQRGWSDTVMKL